MAETSHSARGNLHFSMRDERESMREILSSGSSKTIDKSFRALLGYIESISLENLINTEILEGAGISIQNPLTDVIPAAEDNVVDTDRAALVLRMRDLRLLDYHFNPTEIHSVLVRKHCVLLSLDPFRVVIMADRLIVVVPPQPKAEQNMDQILRMFEKCFNGWHHNDSALNRRINESTKTEIMGEDNIDPAPTPASPEPFFPPVPVAFEVHVYDSVFTTVHTLHCHEFGIVNSEVQNILALLFPRSAVNIPYVLQEKMRSLKDHVSRMITKVGSFRRALSLLLEDDEEMTLMNLTMFKEDPTLYHTPLSPHILSTHDKIEELLEAHLLDADSLEAKLTYLMVTLQSAEASVSLKLDVAQDKIMLANTRLSVAVVMISFAAYWTGVFGMSLDQTITIQYTYGGFEVVFVLTFAIIVFGIPLTLYYLERTGALPRIVRFRSDEGGKKGSDVMGIASMIG